MLTLDGSTLEGGGQLTRMALCLSAITNIPIRVHSIRAGRAAKSFHARGEGYASPINAGVGKNKGGNAKSKDSRDRDDRGPRRGKERGSAAGIGASGRFNGGLKESHLAALRWLAEQCGAAVDGDEVNSREVTFRPGVIKSRYNTTVDATKGSTVHGTIELKTPGSVWLIFQAIFPYMVFASHQHVQSDERGVMTEKRDRLVFDLTLKGGTNVPKSMSTEYVQQVFLPVCERIGLPRVEVETIKRGWSSGVIEVGEVRVKVFTSDRSDGDVSGSDDQKDGRVGEEPTRPELSAGSMPRPFILPSFTLLDRGTITSISTTILSPPHQVPEIFSLVVSTLSSHPSFQALHQPPSVELHPSSSSFDPGASNDFDRRLYILLVAHTSTGIRIGRDFLGTGAKSKNIKDQERVLEMSVQKVVKHLMQEIDDDDEDDDDASGLPVARESDVGVNMQQAVMHGDQASRRLKPKPRIVDEHLQDQLVVFQALACGRSVIGSGTHDEGGNTINDRKAVPHPPNADHSPLNEDNADGHDGEYQGDQQGSLHTRTVRWVCEEVLNQVPVPAADQPQSRPLQSQSQSQSQSRVKINFDPLDDDNNNDNRSNVVKRRIRFEEGGVCHGIGWNAWQ